MTRALSDEFFTPFRNHALHVIAAGKAASAMIASLSRGPHLETKSLVAIGTHHDGALPPGVEWHASAHPTPDQRSVLAGQRALHVASTIRPDECLVLLLSGGASSLMAVPAPGITLDDKRQTVRTMMLAGADIHALNAVRKHLSAIKGGQLAAACPGSFVTLAVSDVIDDDLSVIGSGPGVADRTTWQDAQQALHRFGGSMHVPRVRTRIAQGVAGDIAETPKGGDPSLARASAHVIASARHAIDAARRWAEQHGYDVVVVETPVAGEARDAAPTWLETALRHVTSDRPMCVLSRGETTVRVTGTGRGGRNQEFVLSLVDLLARQKRGMVAGSIGTDGVDGPTDAAGALIDTTTAARGATLGLDPHAFLSDNNAYAYFAMLGDLIHTGPTDTNVGDLQVLLTEPS